MQQLKWRKRKKKYIEAITGYLYCVYMKEPVPEIGTWMVVFEKVSVNVCVCVGRVFSVNADQDSPTIRGCRSWGPAITMLSLCLLTQK